MMSAVRCADFDWSQSLAEPETDRAMLFQIPEGP